MKKSIKNIEIKAVKNIKTIKGGTDETSGNPYHRKGGFVLDLSGPGDN